MKIRDLIRKLLEYDIDADITLTDSKDITLSYIIPYDDNGSELPKDHSNQVFIEGCDTCISCSHSYKLGDINWCAYYNVACLDVDNCYEWKNFIKN